MREAASDYYVVHFRFSHLLDHYKNEYQLKTAVNIISDILKNAEGYVFATADYDIFVFCRNIMPNIVKKMVFQLRYLYMDDPLAYQAEGKENPEFSKFYELRLGWPELLDIAKEKAGVPMLAESKNETPAVKDDGNLTAVKMVNVELELAKINIAQALRSQPVCTSKEKGEWQVIFRENYINIAALAGYLKMRVDLISNRWLFRYLTQILDPKMLEYMARNKRRHLDGAISLNLHIETLLSKAFAEFDKTIDRKFKKNIIIEIQIADVFADMAGFVKARKLAHHHGYRICLDGLTDLSFLEVERNSLKFDLAKIFWHPDLSSRKKQGKELAAAVEKCGGCIILARCDSKDAIRYGRAVGITMFQGRYIDSLVDPKSEIIN